MKTYEIVIVGVGIVMLAATGYVAELALKVWLAHWLWMHL